MSSLRPLDCPVQVLPTFVAFSPFEQRTDRWAASLLNRLHRLLAGLTAMSVVHEICQIESTPFAIRCGNSRMGKRRLLGLTAYAPESVAALLAPGQCDIELPLEHCMQSSRVNISPESSDRWAAQPRRLVRPVTGIVTSPQLSSPTCCASKSNDGRDRSCNHGRSYPPLCSGPESGGWETLRCLPLLVHPIAGKPQPPPMRLHGWARDTRTWSGAHHGDPLDSNDSVEVLQNILHLHRGNHGCRLRKGHAR